MAAGFTIMSALDKSKKPQAEQTPGARFNTQDISIQKMYPGNLNFYQVENIEELAGNILTYGLKQNLEVIYSPCKEGEYRIVTGERRWQALKYLVSQGHQEFEMATCKIIAPQDQDEEQIEIIAANSYRDKTVKDILEEERRLKESLERLKAAGKKIKGYDLSTGRLRDTIARMLNTSKTKIGQIESINNNLIPELKEELYQNRLTFSAAYELSGLPPEKQKEVLSPNGITIGVKDAKKLKGEPREEPEEESRESKEPEEPKEPEETPQESQVPISGTKEFTGMNPPQEFEPEPDKITSLCYSCQKWNQCNEKSNTVESCNEYINKAEAEKTEEQRYSEEQDKIDRETKKKLQEQEDQEKMNHLPSDERKPRIVTIPSSDYMDLCNGDKPFLLLKKDQPFKVGEEIEMQEYKGGERTQREMSAIITYIQEDYKGLEEGYCILGIQVTDYYWS